MKTLTKAYLFVCAMLVFEASIKAQITPDNIYPAASLHLYMVDLENSGMKYLLQSEVQGNRYLKFYDLNHSLWKTIDCNPFPVLPFCGPVQQTYYFDPLYISENLFDCDTSIEFLYVYRSDCRWFTGIYKEDGTVLFAEDSLAPMVKANVPQQFRPIYNTPAGTKMILSHKDGTSRVFNLPCALSTGIDQLTEPPLTEEGNLKAFPNPSFYQTTIEYHLPEGIEHAEIVVADMNGREIKRYKVDRNFSTLLISHNELKQGTYLYSLITENKILDSQKIILLR